MDERHPKAHKLSLWTEAWIKAAATNKRQGGRWAAFVGSPGTGKSHALRSAFEFLRVHGVDLWHCGFHPAPARASFATWSRVAKYEGGHWDDYLDAVRAATFVFLDDVGSETDRYGAGENAEKLRVVLDLCATKWLMLTSNLSQQAFGRGFDHRIQSRLERAKVLDMTGAPDYRPNLRG